ncbi:MAG: secretin and TonB N-terminal domain-containing protein [Candidatus Omnitrophica bacterium]|nr:secretin and TonB N-terminal domain-containing protein [Candidatus Omnitrophota bacterium]
MIRPYMDFVKQPTRNFVFLAGFVCLLGVTNVVLAADPTPSKEVKKVSLPAVTPALAAPATPAIPSPVVKVTPVPVSGDDTISLDFKDADIGSVLRVLSMKSNVNIVTGPDVTGLVTVRLDNVPWEKALDVILRTYDYVYERDGNIIRVTTRANMKLEPVETKAFILNYSKAPEIQASIMDMLSERGKVKSSERTNMVVVTDIPTNLYRIGEVIKKLDKQTSQAFIDSKVVRTSAGTAENLGIDWNLKGGLTKGSVRPTTFPFNSSDGGMPSSIEQFFPVLGSSLTDAASATVTPQDAVNSRNPRAFPYPALAETGNTFSYGTLDFSTLSAVLQMLESYSNAKVVSNPRVVVLNNQTASIQVGDQVPLPTYERNEQTGSMVVSGFSYRDTGVVLKVTPHINSEQEILVDLSPEVSSKTTDQNFGGGIVAPIFNVTQAQTQVLIQSGQTIAIGGLLTDNVTSNENKVPYLADVPLVGKLFRSKRQDPGSSNSKIETLFFVTVTTVDSQGQPVGAKVDGKNDQSQDDQARKKTAAVDAAPGLKGSEKVVSSENANKDKPA